MAAAITRRSGAWARGAVGVALGFSSLLASAPARAQMGEPPDRSEAWDDATLILSLATGGVVFLTPRVFYSDPEVTVGWKARWHVSVLAPSMTLASLTLFNEVVLKDAFESARPDCNADNEGLAGCDSYGLFSTHSFYAFSALGQGVGTFVIDTAKWSGGRFNFGAFAGEVLVPAILGVTTAIGRSAGNWESGGQVWGSAGVGFGTGMLLGVAYALMQRPECGYTGSLICW